MLLKYLTDHPISEKVALAWLACILALLYVLFRDVESDAQIGSFPYGSLTPEEQQSVQRSYARISQRVVGPYNDLLENSGVSEDTVVQLRAQQSLAMRQMVLESGSTLTADDETAAAQHLISGLTKTIGSILGLQVVSITEPHGPRRSRVANV